MDQFNHNTLEQDIKRLSREVKEKRNLPEHKELSERELIKQTLQPWIRPAVPAAPVAPSVAKPAPLIKETFLPDYLKDSPAEIKLQVEKLVDAVFHQGLEKTVKEANRAGAFILDAFHDALTDKLYEELKQRKLI